MALFLSRVDKVRIMIFGRWSSDAFLAYLRPNNPKWTGDMSNLMLQANKERIDFDKSVTRNKNNNHKQKQSTKQHTGNNNVPPSHPSRTETDEHCDYSHHPLDPLLRNDPESALSSFVAPSRYGSSTRTNFPRNVHKF
jgi:hypothetical protein